MAKIELGSTVEDKITGLVGVAMGRTEYLTGCAHVGILPKKLKNDGTIQDWQWLDETRLLVKKDKKIVLESPVQKDSFGGPMPNAPAM